MAVAADPPRSSEIPSGSLPPIGLNELPEPPSPRKILGPGVILVATALGLGVSGWPSPGSASSPTR